MMSRCIIKPSRIDKMSDSADSLKTSITKHKPLTERSEKVPIFSPRLGVFTNDMCMYPKCTLYAYTEELSIPLIEVSKTCTALSDIKRADVPVLPFDLPSMKARNELTSIGGKYENN